MSPTREKRKSQEIAVIDVRRRECVPSFGRSLSSSVVLFSFFKKFFFFFCLPFLATRFQIDCPLNSGEAGPARTNTQLSRSALATSYTASPKTFKHARIVNVLFLSRCMPFSAPLVEQRRKESRNNSTLPVTFFFVDAFFRNNWLKFQIRCSKMCLYVFGVGSAISFFLHASFHPLHANNRRENENHDLLLALDSKSWTSRQRARKR